MAERRRDGAEPGVREHEVAVRQEQALRDVTLDVHILGLPAELSRIPVASDRQDKLDRLTP
jgi:hypothetical protein